MLSAFSVMVAAVIATPLSEAPPSRIAPDVAVVCPAPLLDALGPWIDYRLEQGHCLAFIGTSESTDTIRASILRVAEQGNLRYVLLVGDAEVDAAGVPVDASYCVPVRKIRARVNVRWGSEPEIPSDNWYADFDGDQMPDVAIGRLPVDTPEELTLLVQRILAYERSSDFGPWRRQVNFVAGVGGFGPLADSLIERTTRTFLTNGIPASYGTSMTYASWRSPYCPDPRAFGRESIDRFNEGCLFWIYMGHGDRHRLDNFHYPGGQIPIFETADTDLLRCTHGAPIAIFLSCYTCAFDGDRDCLAEEMLRADGGPVAVIGGSRVMMPYAMGVMAEGWMASCFLEKPKTLGDALLAAKQQMVEPTSVRQNRQLLDAIAGAISPTPDALDAELLEHLHLFHLLGDPLLSLHHPKKVDVETVDRIVAGQSLHVTGTCPIDGQATVELICRRDHLTFTPATRERFDPANEQLVEMTRTYRRANDPIYLVRHIEMVVGPFEITLPTPLECHGPCHVRIFVEGSETFAVGASDVYVRRFRRSRPE